MDRDRGFDLLSFIFVILCLFPLSCCEKIQVDDIVPEDNEKQNDSISVEGISAPFIYKGHAGVPSADGTIMLISKDEWENLSASSKEVSRIIETYTEEGETNWRQPTRDEAKLLKTFQLGSSYDSNQELDSDSSFGSYTLQSMTGGVVSAPLNFILSALGGIPISIDYRYLCESSTYSFSFAEGTAISKVGVKKSDYRLRLVKTISKKDL